MRSRVEVIDFWNFSCGAENQRGIARLVLLRPYASGNHKVRVAFWGGSYEIGHWKFAGSGIFFSVLRFRFIRFFFSVLLAKVPFFGKLEFLSTKETETRVKEKNVSSPPSSDGLF